MRSPLGLAQPSPAVTERMQSDRSLLITNGNVLSRLALGEWIRKRGHCIAKGYRPTDYRTKRARLPALVAAADVYLVTFADVPILQHNSANKFFDSLSAGKPVVLNYGGWQREVLESAGAGLGCAMGDEAAFFANLAALQADEARRAEMGRNARRLALERYNRDLLAAQALKVIIKAAQDYPMLRRSDRI